MCVRASALQLLSIDGTSVEGKKPADISHLIVGPPGSTLDICIRKKLNGAKVPTLLDSIRMSRTHFRLRICVYIKADVQWRLRVLRDALG